MKKLKGYRVMAGYSQKDIAKKIGMGVTSYSLKESGKRQFKKNELERVYLALNERKVDIPMQELFFGQ